MNVKAHPAVRDLREMILRMGARAEAILRGNPADAEFEQAQHSFRKALIRLQVHERRVS